MNPPDFLVWQDDVFPEPGDAAPAPAPAAAPASPAVADPAAEIARIRADKTHPFNNVTDPRHPAAVEEVLALRRVALGDKNVTIAEVAEPGAPADVSGYTRDHLLDALPSEWSTLEQRRYVAAVGKVGASNREGILLAGLLKAHQGKEADTDLHAYWKGDFDANTRAVKSLLAKLAPEDRGELLAVIDHPRILDFVLGIAKRSGS